MNGQNQSKDQTNQIIINSINSSKQSKIEEINQTFNKEKTEITSKKSSNMSESYLQKITPKILIESYKSKSKQKNPIKLIKQNNNKTKNNATPLNLTVNLNNLMLNNIKKLSNSFFDKFGRYNDAQKKYDLEKIYTSLHLSNNSYNFMQRMQFDVYKRQIKNEQLNNLVEKNKIKIDENQRIKAFNRLIEDANRRLEAKINMEDLKNKLEEDIFCIKDMKYSYNEWKNIYEKRFASYQKKINLKNEQERIQDLLQKEQNENDVINLCPKKKASMRHITKMAQKMYDEAKKRKIKKEQKMRIENNINLSKFNINTKKIQSQKISLNSTFDKYDSKSFDKDKQIVFNNKKDNLINCFLLNCFANNENYKTLNNKKFKTSKSSSKISSKKTKEMDTSEFESKRLTLTQNNRISNNSISEYNRYSYNELDKHNIAIDALIDYENSVLEKERNELLRMTEMKKIKSISKKKNKTNENNSKNKEENNNNCLQKNENNEYKKDVSNNQQIIGDKDNKLNERQIETNQIIEEFFFRQLNIH